MFQFLIFFSAQLFPYWITASVRVVVWAGHWPDVGVVTSFRLDHPTKSNANMKTKSDWCSRHSQTSRPSPRQRQQHRGRRGRPLPWLWTKRLWKPLIWIGSCRHKMSLTYTRGSAASCRCRRRSWKSWSRFISDSWRWRWITWHSSFSSWSRVSGDSQTPYTPFKI